MMQDRPTSFKSYNGWAGLIRQVRGNAMYTDLRAGRLKATGKCELCGHDEGLTFHTEEYGSLYQTFLECAHELCGTCHGLIHVRFKYPHRWRRHKHRIATGTTDKIVKVPNIGRFFQIIRGLRDLKDDPGGVITGIKWLDDIGMEAWGDRPPKIALVQRPGGTLRPDPKIYLTDVKVQGLAWIDGKLQPYSWGEDQEDLPF